MFKEKPSTSETLYPGLDLADDALRKSEAEVKSWRNLFRKSTSFRTRLRLVGQFPLGALLTTWRIRTEMDEIKCAIASLPWRPDPSIGPAIKPYRGSHRFF